MPARGELVRLAPMFVLPQRMCLLLLVLCCWCAAAAHAETVTEAPSADNYDLKDAHDDVGSAHVVVEAPPVAVPPPGLVPETLKEEPKQDEPKKALTTPKKAEPTPETRPPPETPPPPVETTTLETPEQQKTRLAEERALIGEARGALNRGDVNAALVALESHRNSFAAGALSEEREALTVLALARVGRHDEAQKRATTFSATWPKSLFQQAIEDALRP